MADQLRPKAEILVTAIAVLHDNGPILPRFVDEAVAVLDREYTNYEILLVDNGSTDATGTIATELLGQHRCLRYIRLTRPADREIAVMAGLDSAIGDYVATLDPDFDPPRELVGMVSECRAGCDVVLGAERNPTRPGFPYRTFRRGFELLSRRLLGVTPVAGTTGYRVLSRQAVNALIRLRQRRRYFAMVVAEVGLCTRIFQYDRISRSGRIPSYRLLSDLRLGLSVIVHNSITLLRLASGLGLLGSFLSFGYSLYVVAVYLSRRDVMPGWTTMSLAMSGLFTLAFLVLTLIGEYLVRLLEESSDRPLYHLREERSSAVMLTDIERRNVLEQPEGEI